VAARHGSDLPVDPARAARMVRVPPDGMQPVIPGTKLLAAAVAIERLVQ
jgi:hypothetical protein